MRMEVEMGMGMIMGRNEVAVGRNRPGLATRRRERLRGGRAIGVDSRDERLDGGDRRGLDKSWGLRPDC